VFSVPQEAKGRQYDRGSASEPLHDFSRLFEQPHMGVAGGESAIWLRVGWIVLNREEEFRHSLIETSTQEMCPAYQCERVPDAGARTETERGIRILYRDIGLPGPTSENDAGISASREARVKSNSAVSQSCHRDRCPRRNRRAL
jgi:hypothetical protein